MHGITLMQVGAPSVEPLTLVEAKAHLKVDVTADDALIQAWLQAARQHVEGFTGRALAPQEWEVRMGDFPWYCGYVELPNPPLIEILSAKTVDAAGVETLIPASSYMVEAPSGDRAGPARLYPSGTAEWPSVDSNVRGAFRVRYRAGYTSPGAIPAPLRAAMLLLLGDFYENREGTMSRNLVENPAVERLLRPYRLVTL